MDLSRIRHDLRTPINHIIGYCEMVQEEEGLSDAFQRDLEKIHHGGKQLQLLINEYFDEEVFEEKKGDLKELYHDLRTPVNYILGYSEMLQELAGEEARESLIPDLQKIHKAAKNWLGLMEEHLLPAHASGDFPDGERGGAGASQVNTEILIPGVEYRVPPAQNVGVSGSAEGRILVVDDDPENREMLKRRLQKQGYTVVEAEDGLQAMNTLRNGEIELVLLDLIMPGIDGYQVLTRMKSDDRMSGIPVIMISALDQENGIARCIELGAEDYLSKPFNPIFLRARIGACLEKKRLRDQERKTFRALNTSQKKLAGELAEAGAYVRSLLPEKLTGSIGIDYCFQPSAQLGGDAFGYHWIDDDHFAIYLLDVCGHGVGAALLSISVLNVLRAQSLPGVAFENPSSVLEGLNRTFEMERQNNMYFTLWYGVLNRSTGELTYSSGGHPPAILLAAKGDSKPETALLSTGNPIIGFMEESEFANKACSIPDGACLYIFSDGVYEIPKQDGQVMTLEEFTEHLVSESGEEGDHPEAIYDHIRKTNTDPELEDDFSILKIQFGVVSQAGR